MDFLTQPFAPNPASPRTAQTATADGASVSDSATLVSPSDHHYSAGGGTASAEGLIPTPAIRNGDRKFLSEIRAVVTIWPDGTLGNRSGAGKESAIVEEDWVTDGTLWLTKDEQLLFILDPSYPPRPIRRPISPATRHANLARTTSPSADAPGSPTQDGTKSSGILGKIKSILTPGNKDANADEDDNALTRTVTGERMTTLSRIKTSDFPRRRSSAAAAEKPASGVLNKPPTATSTTQTVPAESMAEARLHDESCPLPEWRGQRITALHVADPSSVLTLRYAPFVSARQPATIELDIGVPRNKVRLTGYGLPTQAREVTIKFKFGEALMAAEAEDLKVAIEGFFREGPGGR